MTQKISRRIQLIREINEAGRTMSTATVIFHQAVAEKTGMSAADHKYLDILMQAGKMTAGRLAEITGLTTGAITGIIDRLEQEGFVKRERDPHDRRKVVVVPVNEKIMKRMAPVFGTLQSDLTHFLDKYTDKELETILTYLTDTFDFFNKKTVQIKEGS